MAGLQKTALFTVAAFTVMSLLLLIVHEMHTTQFGHELAAEGGKIFHRIEHIVEDEVIVRICITSPLGLHLTLFIHSF